MKKIILSLIFSCTFPSISGATSIPNPGADIYGAGNSSCSVWTKKRAQKDYFQMGQWMLGSISGAAAFGPELRGGSSQEFATWIDNYCLRNPSDKFSLAVAVLIIDLQLTPQEKAAKKKVAEQKKKTAEQKSLDNWYSLIADFKKHAKSNDSIDYDDPTLGTMWDREVQRLGGLPENEDKSAFWFLSEAHKNVKKTLGLK